MLEKLQNRLKMASNFPSPPAVAQQIIELAQDPDIDVLKVATAMSRDPALTAKILRIANSPLYTKQRKSDNLRQALVVLGLNAATTLSLSFSLVGTYSKLKSSRLDYTRYWRRAILGASAARAFAELKKLEGVEDVFLAALLQDIAVIAIDRVQPDFYADLPARATHSQLIAHEIHTLGVDHASVSAWLLRFWRLPEALCQTVEWSHAPDSTDDGTRGGLAARCVALGSECAEMLLGDRTSLKLSALSSSSEAWLGIGNVAFGATMESIVGQLPEIERLFDASLLDDDVCGAILEQAREMLVIRNLQTVQQVDDLQRATEHFAARTALLEDQHRRDSLTGVYNRGHLDRVLETEFRSALVGGWPLSLIFADIDRFKEVNDTYGHPAGDSVLVATAQVIVNTVRDTDCVARYGGEEFVVILPGLGTEGAHKVAERILDRLRASRHIVAGSSLIATASLGLATHDASMRFETSAKLLEAADRSVYSAKRQGRNQVVIYDPERDATQRLVTAEVRAW